MTVIPLRPSAEPAAGDTVSVVVEAGHSTLLDINVPASGERAIRLTVRCSLEHVAMPPLSPEEQQLWRLVAEGTRPGRVCEELFVSERTLKRRTSSLLRKLGVDNRAQAAVLAGRCGLFDVPASSGPGSHRPPVTA